MTAAFGTAGAVRLGLGVADPRPRRPAGDRLYPSQDNPLMDAGDVHGTPLLGNDLWEHAYYLAYRNRRADYLDAWWQLVDWAEVSRRYTAATARS